MYHPLISVATVCLNAAESMERTIQAVLGQSYPNIEYIVIDGGSTDGTLDVIERYRSRIAYFGSGPDRGIADAFNKAVRQAKGKYFGLVNAGDWPERDNIAFAVEDLERHPGAAFAFGDLVIHRGGTAVFRYDGASDYGFGVSMGRLNHPTMICRRALFDEIGLFDTRYKVAMDFDWISRLHAAGHRGIYDGRIRGHMESDGASVKYMFRALAESRDAALAAGLPSFRVWRHYLRACVTGQLRLWVESNISHEMSQWLRRRLFQCVAELPEP